LHRLCLHMYSLTLQPYCVSRLTRGMAHDDYKFLCKFHLVCTSYVIAKVSLQTYMLWVPSQGSLSTHCTCDLSPALIRRTRNACTLSSDMVEQGSICIHWTARHWIRVHIHTLVHWAMVSVVVSHQVTVVLTSPGGGARCLSRNHNGRSTSWSIAHSAWYNPATLSIILKVPAWTFSHFSSQ